MRKKYPAFWYVANAGIILETAQGCIGIDCFCKDPNKQYADTPDFVRKAILEQIKQKNMKMLLFTHEHGDHFFASDVKKALQNNSELIIAAGEATAEELLKTGIHPENIHVFARDKLNSSVFSAGIEIQALNCIHDGSMYKNVQNLAFMIHLDDRYLVITGDAEGNKELFHEIAKWKKELDWMFLPFPFVGRSSIRRHIVSELMTRNIFVLHQPRHQKDPFHWVDSAKKVCEEAKDGLPLPIFPDMPGVRYDL